MTDVLFGAVMGASEWLKAATFVKEIILITLMIINIVVIVMLYKTIVLCLHIAQFVASLSLKLTRRNCRENKSIPDPDQQRTVSVNKLIGHNLSGK